jgi:hypothetical protein
LSRTLNTLGKAAEGLTQPQFESIVFGLSPQAKRLFLYLSEHGTTGTIELRENCAIGNVSQARATLNEKLRAAGDDRQVICELKTIKNRYGESGTLGQWSLTTMPAKAVNDAA